MDQHHPSIVSRLAPTPSGYLHVGNLFNFVLTWLHVRIQDGRLILRIDDLDQARVRDRYLDDIFYALDWLELDYDHGPADTTDFKANFSQTLRVSNYLETVDRIKASAPTFYCRCSRKDIEQLSTKRHYQGTCKDLGLPPEDRTRALRLHTDDTSKISLRESDQGSASSSIHELMPYPVLIKKDGIPTYQVASLTDDTAMKVNFLVRGKDLWTSSLTQAYLAKLAGLENFNKAQFIHHDLIEGTDRLKLSKSQKAPSYERTDLNKAELISTVGRYMGISNRLTSMRELLDAIRSKPL